MIKFMRHSSHFACSAGLITLLALSACRDANGPQAPWQVETAQVYGGNGNIGNGQQLNILRQAPTAPPLATYQVTFWAYEDKASGAAVNYVTGEPFLRFQVQRNGLVAGAGGTQLNRGDSVAITLTIDPVYFTVDFQPSGVAFGSQAPAVLAISYANADADLNGNGVVDGSDRRLIGQLAIWIRDNKYASWEQLLSKNDMTSQYIAGAVPHFSQFAVSW
jgi:hypothetical protein